MGIFTECPRCSDYGPTEPGPGCCAKEAFLRGVRAGLERAGSAVIAATGYDNPAIGGKVTAFRAIRSIDPATVEDKA